MRQTIFSIGLVAVFGLAACTSNETQTQQEQATVAQPKVLENIKQNCSAPAQVPDIWKLEPMLTKSGLIEEGMSKEQKEKIIRDYIRKTNEEFMKRCKSGK